MDAAAVYARFAKSQALNGERSALVATMDDLRRSRGVVWLSNEGWTVLPDVAARLPEGLSPQFILARNGAPVAITDPHGRSVRLLA